MNLIPGVSTHFRLMSHAGNNPIDLTIGKVYKITEWEGYIFEFLDDIGDRREWSENLGTRYQNSGKVSCASFEVKLQKILGE